ncbi:glycosyltransferase family 2 protein [Aliiglaciecola lipolytica]|uniref:glycosyltransferase family 2 protein n=1 Tax=Aliiglaciecola lipolytica TaxID=477689 RepID=UPI0002EF349C|nr:glycosyltransferase [Aliiglaciecola lipolytica]
MEVLSLPLQQNNSPIFSIVIPVFNRSESLFRALNSVMQQSLQAFEVLVVDDGSNADFADKIRIVVEGFQDSRVHLLRHDVNKNGAAARNTGINAAKGKYICFLDSDDVWLPSKLAKTVNCIDANAPTKTFLIHHQYQNKLNTVLSSPIPLKAKHTSESVTHYSFVTNQAGGIQSSTICVPTALAKEIQFNETLKGHQDWDFVFRLAEKTNAFWFIEEPLTIRYCDSNDSVANSLDWQYSLWFYGQLSRCFDYPSAYNYFQRVILKRAKFTTSYTRLFCNSLYFRLLIRRPVDVIRFTSVFIKSANQYQKRLQGLFNKLAELDASHILIWGANDYAKSIILRKNKRFSVLKVIDSKASKSNNQFLGVNLSAIQSINSKDIDKVQAIVLATDRHAASMTSELTEHFSAAEHKVIPF